MLEVLTALARFGYYKNPVPIQVWPSVVRSVERTTCTVVLSGTELEVAGVNLYADEDASAGLLLTPAVGSLIYVASLENSLDSLFVCCYSELDKATLNIGNAALYLDKDGVSLTDGQSKVALSGG